MSLPLASIPKPAASYKDALAAELLATDTTGTLESGLDDNGQAYDGVVGLTVDGEYIVCNKSGTALTGMLRGVDPQDGTTERTGLKARHRRGAVVKVTDWSFLAIVYRLLNGTERFPNQLKFTNHPVLDADSDTAVDAELVTFGQLARVVVAGAANASATVKGIVEEATLAEALAGTATGGTGARLYVSPDILQQILQGAVSTYVIEDGSGSDDTYTGVATPTPTGFTAGMIFRVKFTIANTGAATLNPSGLGAKAIKKYVSGAKADIETGDIVANYVGILEYDGTDFVLLSMTATMPTTALLSEMATFFNNTNFNASQAESLIGGIAAPLITLHAHKRSQAVGSYTSGTPGSVVIAHGLGVAPNWIEVRAYRAATNGLMGMVSDGAYNGAYATSYITATAMANATDRIASHNNDSGSGISSLTVGSVDATNITFTNAVTSSPPGTIFITVVCGV